MNQDYAQFLLNKTRDDYNAIAEDFSNTRRYNWRGFEFLTQYVGPGDKVLDLGCGNGRLLELLQEKKINYIGLDNSSALIALAQKKYPGADFRTGDALSLPFTDNYFDKIYSIAVLHHIPSQELRIKFLAEAKRVLKPGGLLILTVWDLQRGRVWLRLKFFLKKMFGLSKLDVGDVFVPWAKKYQRYVHCFTKSELKELFEKSGLETKEINNLGDNIYAILTK